MALTYREYLNQLESKLSITEDAYMEMCNSICEQLGYCSTKDAEDIATKDHNKQFFEVKDAYLAAREDLKRLKWYLNKFAVDLGQPLHSAKSA